MKTLDEFRNFCLSKYYTTRKSLYFSWGNTHFAHCKQLKLSISRSIGFCDYMMEGAPVTSSRYSSYKEERVILIELWNYFMENK